MCIYIHIYIYVIIFRVYEPPIQGLKTIPQERLKTPHVFPHENCSDEVPTHWSLTACVAGSPHNKGGRTAV